MFGHKMPYIDKMIVDFSTYYQDNLISFGEI